MNERPAIAVIGLGCRYPGAATLREFWENVVARRRQFRRLPAERLPLDEYYSEDPSTPDKTYAREAAVIDGFDFDWVGRGIPKPIFEAGDIVHWLALEVALTALEDAGYALGDGLSKERAGVILGNTLTGEHTRANTMRLRWPFIERTIRAAAQSRGLSPELTEQLAATTEQYFKSVFPPTTEDTLAGGLSNTISGRICGYLGLHGGGYTVDGACSSSLIAVATAASALDDGTLDVALAGGVDISLDTFELIGFSKAGALTKKDDLHVYDRRASGFKPGEGCGFVVLKRLEDARNDGDYVYAVLRGWGISSDGSRTVTAPKADGQARAIRRAYERTEYGPQDLTFVEGHGTGTAVGDVVELTGIGLAMQGDEAPKPRTCGVTSLKSIIGHTKAAAGVGGLIKAIMGANRRVLAPVADCTEPHPVFDDAAKPLYPIMQGEVRPAFETFRVGVSAAGFGGINCHVTLESGDAPAPQLASEINERALLVSSQETELFVVAAASPDELIERVDAVLGLADGISYAEMVDLAAKLAGQLDPSCPVRAAVVAGKPGELIEKLDELKRMLAERPPCPGQITTTPDRSIWIGNEVDRAQVAFLFPGQGSQMLNMARTLVERFDWARELVDRAAEWLREYGLEGIKGLMYPPVDRAVDAEQLGDWTDQLKRTEVAQPAICLASLLWRRHLERLGVEPVAVGGHSLGELSAFCAAGAFDEETLIRLAAVRGRAMAARADNPGAMASLGCPPEVATRLVREADGDVVVANLNSFTQTVISGDASAVEEIVERASTEGIRAKVLPVSNAFHSGHVADAAERLRDEASLTEVLQETRTKLFTSTDGSQVVEGLGLADHFADQVVSQVHFIAMVAAMYGQCDVFVEVGPGRVLSGLVGSICGADGPVCLPVESKPGSDRDLNTLVGCLFARGATIDFSGLYENRLVREFVPAGERLFIDNPCERPFQVDGVAVPRPIASSGALEAMIAQQAGVSPEVLSDYVARRGPFLAAVVRADLESSSGAVAAQPVASANAAAAEAAAPAAAPRTEATQNAETADASIPQMLLEAIEQLTGFPPESMSMEMRLIDDLNLDSIKAAELIASVAKRLGIAGELDPSQFANATLQEVADNLAELARPEETSGAGARKPAAKALPTWVRNFVVDYVEEAPEADAEAAAADWTGQKVLVLSEDEEYDVAEALRDRLAGARVVCRGFDSVPGEGPVEGNYSTLIAVLPRSGQRDDSANERLERMIHRLRSTAAVPRAKERSRSATVAYVQFAGGDFGSRRPEADVDRMCAKAVGASLHLERDDLKVRVLDFAPEADATAVADKVALELATSEGFAAVGYDDELTRRMPRLRLSDPATYAERDIVWTGDDVILVTGGAKGITAECVLAVAEKTGVRMALVGSSPLPAEDSDNAKSSEITKTLSRFAEKGLTARYYQCNVADADAVARLVDQIEADLGPVTGVVHGAAVNKPRLLGDVSTDEAYREVAPKVLGTINLCRALAAKPPKMFAGLSSIIGVSGMWRNGWYGFSNEAMTQILAQFQAEHPETAVVALAYSVWDEVGMGFRMGSTDYLASRGVAAIPAEEGVRRFVQLFQSDPGQAQVVITARIDRVSGLEATLKFTDLPAMPRANRFLEDIKHICPGVEVVSQVHLDVERDPYLKDHVWKGSHLFPTVFGLEAMAQATAYVTAAENLDSVRIENIRLDRPIVVDPKEGLDIQIRAEVLERSAADAPLRVKVGISTAMNGFARDHFSAEFVLARDLPTEIEDVDLPEQPLAIDPMRDLYGDLLFQGPRFQRLRKVHSLDSSRCVFASEITPSDAEPESESSDEVLLLGDAYFRDSLLQSVQMVAPQEIALPVRIDRLERRRLEDRSARRLTAVAVNEGEVDGNRVFTVVAVDGEGRVVERLEGYTLGIVEHRPENPTAEELADPGRRDERILRENLDELSEAFGLQAPEPHVAHMPDLHSLPKDERHVRELPLLAQVAQAAMGNGESRGHTLTIRWLDSGKPVVESEADEQPGVSLSHDDQTLFCVGGRGSQGCDLHPVETRNREDWIALLSNARMPLLDELVDGDSLDRAGTRIWSAQEAVRKATGDRQIELQVKGRSGEGVLFVAHTDSGETTVLTFPMKLTLGPEKMVAVVVSCTEATEAEATEGQAAEPQAQANHAPAADLAGETTRATHPGNDPALLARLGFDSGQYRMEMTQGSRGEPVLIVRWPLSFRDNRTPGGGIYFSNYFAWMGKIREMAISPILDRLADDMAGGEWGMVTNNGEVHVLGDVTGSGLVEAHAWMEGLSGRDNSTIELRFEWFEVLPDGRRERIATGQMQITWVRVLGHGQVEVAPLPEYVQDYMRTVTARGDRPAEEKTSSAATLKLGDELHRTSYGPRAGKVLREQTVQTSLEDANLVGNIYFDNYSKWQGRLRDLFLFEAAPHLLRGGAPEGELMCRHCRVHHIREAMPFDRIHVSMGLRAVYEQGVKLEFEYTRINPDGSREKLAFAEHEAVWVTRDAEGRPIEAPLPAELLGQLCDEPATCELQR